MYPDQEYLNKAVILLIALTVMQTLSVVFIYSNNIIGGILPAIR